MNDDFSKAQAEFQEAGKSLGGLMEYILPRNTPELLYHYTNSSGLLGMLNSSMMWATNFRYLNDSSEITYGSQLLNDVLDGLIKKQADSDVITFLERCKITHNAFDGMLDCYIACLCEGEDLLSQWREYASKGGGFAIGFMTRYLRVRLPNSPQSIQKQFDLLRVVYDETVQRDLITQIINKAIGVIIGAKEKSPDVVARAFIPAGCQFIRNSVYPYLSCFKHPCFSVEKEWRLIHWTTYAEDQHIKVRDGNYGLTPYVELDIKAELGPLHNMLPIDMIKHGPTSDPSNTAHALNMLLKSKGYPHITTVGSKLPVRKL